MQRSVLYIGAGLLALWVGVVGLSSLREREAARRLAHEAEQGLSISLARAPELTQIPAARAVTLLEEAIATYDEPAHRRLLGWAQALFAFQKGRFDSARKTLAQGGAIPREHADLRVLEAAIAMRLGETDVASAAIERILSAHPKHLRARLLAADLSADRDQPERALSLLQALIDEQPKIAALYNRRGLLREALGDLSAAIADFERATELDSSLPQPFLNLGRLERARGNARAAETAFANALARDDGQTEAWLGRGLSRVAQGDVTGGALDVQHARDLAPAEPAPLIALGDIDVRSGTLEDAVARYQAAIALAQDDAVAWLKLGNTLARMTQYAQARAAFERALALRPGLAAAHNGLGATLMALDDPQNAEKAFATAAELDSSDPNPLRNLALLHIRQGDLRAARGAYAEANARVQSL